MMISPNLGSPTILAPAVSDAAAPVASSGIAVRDVIDSLDNSSSPAKGLYQSADGGFYIAGNGLTAGASLSVDAISLTAKGKAWSSGKADVIALRVTDDGFEVLTRAGSGSKIKYAIQAFDSSGAAVDRASKLTTIGMLGAEVAFDQDVNGDGFLGDIVSNVADAENSVQGPSVGLYELASGRFAIDVNGQSANAATTSDVAYLTSKGKNWSPGKGEPLAVRTTDAGFEVLLKYGSGAKGRYSVQIFDHAGVAVGKASKLSNVELLNAQSSYDQDFTGDGYKSDVVAAVADSSDANDITAKYGLYQLTSQRFAIDANGLSKNSELSGSAVFLSSKGKAWTSGKAIALGVRSAGAEFEILLKTGEGGKAKFQLQTFTAAGEVSGKGRSLDPAGLMDAEVTFKQEFNNDSILGDYVTDVLDAEDPTGNGGLYKMASGFVAIGDANLSVGATASSLDFLRLTNNGKVWGAGKSVPIALAPTGEADDPSGASLILKSGTGSKIKLSEVAFDESGALITKASSLKAPAVLEKEITYDQDLDSDGKVGTSAFDIKVNFTGDAKYKPYFDLAAARWSQIILNDLPDVANQSYNWSNVSGYEALGSKNYGTIDDLLLEAVMYDGGNNGNLGSAGPMTQRADGMPIIGRMRFNTYYMSSMISNNTFGDVILHEMGHVLGLGTRWASLKNVDGDYSGSAAVQQYTLITGQTQTSVPVEKTGGAGTAGAHWAEDIFGSELMTGWAENSPPMPLSRVTVGSLEDLGYNVSYAMADAFDIGSAMSGLAADAAAPSGSLHQMACRCMTCEIKQMADGTIGVELNVSTITFNA